jgi:CheY-like chemotaxis protein
MDDTVLLIEADAVIRKHLSALIRESGHGCCPVASVRAGLDELRQRPYSFVILDFDLLGACPPAAGVTSDEGRVSRGKKKNSSSLDTRPSSVARRLRSAHPDVCLIGLDSMGQRGSSLFDAVIPKPFVFDALLEVLVEKAH